jgi:hypothetical protein
LPAKGKQQDSLPDAFSLEQLSKTMSNPRYADDIFRLDRFYDTRKAINKETVIIVVGTITLYPNPWYSFQNSGQGSRGPPHTKMSG